jgi:hypothetical protein
MNLKYSALMIISLLLAGCIAPPQYAQITGRLIRNPSFGLAYEFPEGVSLYERQASPPWSALHQAVLRINELNNEYHPSGNEIFYESFLMFTEQTAFLLIMAEHGSDISRELAWDDAGLNAKELLPLYNEEHSRPVQLDGARATGRLSAGTAYEKKGWYYPRSKPGRTAFCYEACKLDGLGRDRYILMGFSAPENRQLLSVQMQDMMRGFK